MLGILDFIVHIPEHSLDPMLEYSSLNLTKEEGEVYKKFFKIESIRYEKNLTASDIFSNLVQQILEKNYLQTHQIRYVAHAKTATYDHVFGRSIVLDVVQRCKLVHAIPFACAFNKCASLCDVFELLSVAHLGDNEYALVLTGDIAFTPDLRSIPNISLTSDILVAALVSNKSEKRKIVAISSTFDGSFALGIWMPSEQINTMSTKLPNVFSDLIDKTTALAQIQREDVKILLPHNVNILLWTKIAKKISFPRDRIFLKNIPIFGHAFNSDLLLNYHAVEHMGLLAPNDYLLALSVGTGASFSACLLQH